MYLILICHLEQGREVKVKEGSVAGPGSVQAALLRAVRPGRPSGAPSGSGSGRRKCHLVLLVGSLGRLQCGAEGF